MFTLPDRFTVRAPTIDDLAGVVDLINRCTRARAGVADYSESYLRRSWEEDGRDLSTDNWLVVTAEGRLVAYADISEYDPYDVNEFEYYVDPGLVGRGIEEFLIATAERRVRASIAKAPDGARVALETFAWASDEDEQRRLAGLGYAPNRVWHRMQIDMGDEPPPPPEWPTGIELRAFVPGEEDVVHAAWEDAQRDEWGHPTLTDAQFRYYFVESEPDFDPTLWFLAVDNDTGEMAGYVLGRWERPGEPDCGQIRYVGVRRHYRRRGVATALLRHAFREYHRRGKRKVGLAVDAESPTGADRLYERAGMRAVQSRVIFEKVLREVGS
jgi:mycothiol synthase